jgi:lipoate-protein ligase B
VIFSPSANIGGTVARDIPRGYPAQLLELDRLPYREAHKLMLGLVAAKRRSPGPEILLLVEHEPVLTLGRRGTDADILVAPEVLAAKGLVTHRVERGGLATYHGPGQLLAYPIFDLRRLGISVDRLVRRLEDVIIDTLAAFGLKASRKPGYPGAWLGADKIAAVGLSIRGGISFHGIALNYDPDLSYFDLIRPCGLEGVRMTSMAKVLGQRVHPHRLRETMTGYFARRFNLELSGCSLAQLDNL